MRMSDPHEFREDVNDASMCMCGIPALTHDAVMLRMTSKAPSSDSQPLAADSGTPEQPPTNESPHLAAKYWWERQAARAEAGVAWEAHSQVVTQNDELRAALTRVEARCEDAEDQRRWLTAFEIRNALKTLYADAPTEPALELERERDAPSRPTDYLRGYRDGLNTVLAAIYRDPLHTKRLSDGLG